MIYKVRWIECHDPNNWGDTYEKGKKTILETFPNAEVEDVAGDGWLTIHCEDRFEAIDIEDAKRYMRNDFDFDADVFTVVDEQNRRVFTEEFI